MTEIQKHRADEMTPVERKKAIEEGKSCPASLLWEN